MLNLFIYSNKLLILSAQLLLPCYLQLHDALQHPRPEHAGHRRPDPRPGQPRGQVHLQQPDHLPHQAQPRQDLAQEGQ